MVSRTEVERFRDLIALRLGLWFDDDKLESLEDLLQWRARERELAPGAYLVRMETNSHDELGPLAAELTVGETYFFRNIDQFRALSEVAFASRRVARQASKRLRVLSAGCASGDEAYTIAIVAREAALDANWSVSIRAIDANPEAIERASRGRYTKWSLRETPADSQRRWFRPDGAEFVLDESIRAAVQFEARNLAIEDDNLWVPGAYDVIFCRNVLMYFTPDAARAAVARIARALAPGGYLFLGHAETLRALSSDFHLCHTHGTFYYQRRSDGDAPPLNLESSASVPATELVSVVDAADSWVDAIHRAAERIRVLATKPPAGASALVATWDLGHALELLRQERFADALTSLDRLPPESTRDPDALLLRAVLLAHGGQFSAAEEVCADLLAADAHCAGAHYVLALCRETAGDRQVAMEHDQVAIYVDPTFAMARLHLGLLARRLGDRDVARRELGQAIVLLQREDASRLLLFGGGFQREALISLCRAELAATGGDRE